MTPPNSDAPWWERPLVGFDLETTGPEPQDDHVVTAAVAVCSRDGIERHDWIADPGVPIPEGATAVHGITTAKAQAEGRPLAEVVAEVLNVLERWCGGEGAAWCVTNSRFDFTVLARDAGRLGLALPDGFPWMGVDPRVVDPFLDRYRKSYPTGYTPESAKAAGIPSSRTLEGMCKVYGVKLDGAHDAAWDAIAACRLAFRMGSRGRVVRRKAHEREPLQREWDGVRGDLVNLFDWQKRVALNERERFAEYKAGQGEHDEAARIRAERGWPVLEPRQPGDPLPAGADPVLA